MKDISVIVLTYHPDMNKLIETIESIINQKQISFEIIISEDSAQNQFYDSLRKYFEKHNFTNYIFVENDGNVGTVNNLLRALEKANGKYIKAISPGDMLYSNGVLKRYFSIMEEKKADMSFGEVKCYYKQDQQQVFVKKYFPRDVKPYQREEKNKILKNILIKNDWPCGASSFYKRDCLKQYLDGISGQVKYCEDGILLSMVMDGKMPVYIEEYTVVYEWGVGISTTQNKEAKERVRKDQISLCNYLLEKYSEYRKIIRRRRKWMCFPRNNKNILRIYEMLFLPEYVWAVIKYKIVGARRINEENTY